MSRKSSKRQWRRLGENPLVTVVIPTYNRRTLVQRSIESALRQTYRNIEVIVVDDGSTDGTKETLQSLSPQVHYIYQENQGLAAARNRAIRVARGKLIALLDSDDWWTDDKLERCVAYLRLHPDVDVVYSPMRTVDGDGNPMRGHDRVGREGDLLELLFENIVVHDPAAVFHKRVWTHVGGFDESLPVCVGHNFWLRVAVEHRFGYIPEPLAVRTWLPDSLTRSQRARGATIKAAMLESFYLLHGGCLRLDPGRASRALARAHYSAGKLCARNGQIAKGLALMRAALAYRPFWHKALMHYAAISLRHPFASRRLCTPTDARLFWPDAA